VQTEPVDETAIPDLIEAMHAECDIDIDDPDVWNEVLLVPPSEVEDGYNSITDPDGLEGKI